MGIMCSVEFEGVAVTAAQDLFELHGSGTVNVIHAVIITQSSDVGDTENEQLRIKLKHGNTLVSAGSGGAAASTLALDRTITQALKSDAISNNTTKASSGTIVDLWSEAFNIHTGFFWMPTPEMRITIPYAEYFIVELVAAPADSLTMSGTLIFESFNG